MRLLNCLKNSEYTFKKCNVTTFRRINEYTEIFRASSRGNVFCNMFEDNSIELDFKSEEFR